MPTGVSMKKYSKKLQNLLKDLNDLIGYYKECGKNPENDFKPHELYLDREQYDLFTKEYGRTHYRDIPVKKAG